jgi:hypothetical protein
MGHCLAITFAKGRNCRLIFLENFLKSYKFSKHVKVWATNHKKRKIKWYKYILNLYRVYCLLGYSLPTLHTCPFKDFWTKAKKKRRKEDVGQPGATIIHSECRGRKTSRKQVDHDRLPNTHFLITNLPTKPTHEVGRSSNHPPKPQRVTPSNLAVLLSPFFCPPPPPSRLPFFLFRELGWISWRWTSGLLHETLWNNNHTRRASSGKTIVK